jgi:hypothetical protein
MVARHQDEDKGCDRREETGGEECDTGLVAEGGQVIDAGETHDAPPRVFTRGVGGVSTLGTFEIGKKPVGESKLLLSTSYLDNQGLCTE